MGYVLGPRTLAQHARVRTPTETGDTGGGRRGPAATPAVKYTGKPFNLIYKMLNTFEQVKQYDNILLQLPL